MISDRDSLALAPGVELRGASLADDVRGCSWPLNESGAFVLARPGCSLGEVVRDLSVAASVPLEAARADVLRFVFALNGFALVNVTRSGSRLCHAGDWLRLAVRLAPAGTLPTPLTRRRALDTRSARRAIISALRAATPRMAAVAALAAVVAAQIAVVAGGPTLSVALAAGLGVGTGIGVGLHEAGHAACLVGIPGALVVRGRRTFVLHAPVSGPRRVAVALAGPATATGAGLVIVTAALVGLPALVVVGLPLVAHALGLTAAAGDGRVACAT